MLPAYTDIAAIWLSAFNSTFYPFTSERFHVLWTLSSKFFSTVPHGTCALSDSRPYLALGGVYHLLRAAIPNNPTLRTAITAGLPARGYDNRPFTCYGQTTIKRSRVAWPIGYKKAVPNATTSSCRRGQRNSAMGFSYFTRRYCRNHCYCLFLRLVICLNSAGSPARLRSCLENNFN